MNKACTIGVNANSDLVSLDEKKFIILDCQGSNNMDNKGNID